MRGQEIQNKHTKVYQNFFSHHDLVISLPQVVAIFGESRKYHKLQSSLGFKIPQKIYVGAKFGNKKGPKTHYIYYNSQTKTFHNDDLKNFYNIDNTILKDLGIDFEINFLAEHNNFESTYVLVILVLLVLIQKEQIKAKEIEKINYEKAEKIFQKVEKIFQTKEKEITTIHNARPQLHYIAQSIYDSAAILQYNTKQGIQEVTSKQPRNKSFNYYLINQHLPFQIHSLMSNLKDNNHKKLAALLEKLENFFIKKIIYELTIENKDSNFNNIIKCINNYHSIIKTLLEPKIIQIISSEKAKKIIQDQIEFTTQQDDLHIHTNKNMHIITNKYTHLSQKNIQNINSIKRSKFSLDYASNIDGIQKKGLKIEQWKQKSIFSQFCSKYEIKVIKDQHISKQALEYHQALKKNDGILFDSVQNKVRILGEGVNSKEIHSQSTTIEIFKTIVQQRGKEVYNKSLPPSCYSKNKNAMLGKIILPLRKTINNKTGKEIKIKCHGSLNHFYIKLEHSPVPVYYLQQKMN